MELRAEGLSFAKIAARLKVSKPTLLKWQVEFAAEIQRTRFYAVEALAEEYKLRKYHRIKAIANSLQKAQAELDKRAAPRRLDSKSGQRKWIMVVIDRATACRRA